MSSGTYSPCERFRRARGWSQVRLAGIAGVGTTIVAAIEHGRIARLRVETLVRIARALGCAVVDLVPGLATRESMGGKVQESGTAMRAHGRAQHEYARRKLLEILTSLGGKAIAADVIALLGESGVSRRLAIVCRRELSREGKVEAEQLRGIRPGVRAWEWRLKDCAVAADALFGPPARQGASADSTDIRV
jgi:transcriptional regulator with XRE-family HTH domain